MPRRERHAVGTHVGTSLNSQFGAPSACRLTEWKLACGSSRLRWSPEVLNWIFRLLLMLTLRRCPLA